MRQHNNKHVRNARRVAIERRNLTDVEVFKVAYQRYRLIQEHEIPAGARRALRDREFVADFELLARRKLSPRQYALFRYVYIWQANPDSILTTVALGVPTKLDLLLARERIESIVGAACKDVKPYPLFPLKEYFRDPERKETAWQRGRNDQYQQQIQA